MVFFTDRWTIAEIDPKNIILVRKSKDNILLERVVGDTSINSREIIAKDVLEEYDLGIGPKNSVYILYQNKDGQLILKVLKGKKIEEIQLTQESISEVFELNIIVKDKMIHILYAIRVSNEEAKYRICHHYYNGSNWNDNIVEEINVNKVLNPIRIEQSGSSILLFYYDNDKSIELKEFNMDKLEWNEKVTLVHTENNKLFLDVLKVDDIIHLTYGEFVHGSLVIMYNKLYYDNGKYEKVEEYFISNEGSPSHPNIIFFENRLWITWVELNKIMSRCSIDDGQSWEDIIYMWNNSRDIDFVRYKYLNLEPKDNTLLRHSLGSVYPEVVFMGFGPLDNVVEVPVKKKNYMRLPQI